MKDSGTYRQNPEETVHLLENLDKDLEKMIEDMEKYQMDRADQIDLDKIIKHLDKMSGSLEKLAVKTQLLQCNLIVCFGHPDKTEALKGKEESYVHPRTVLEQEIDPTQL